MAKYILFIFFLLAVALYKVPLVHAETCPTFSEFQEIAEQFSHINAYMGEHFCLPLKNVSIKFRQELAEDPNFIEGECTYSYAVPKRTRDLLPLQDRELLDTISVVYDVLIGKIGDLCLAPYQDHACIDYSICTSSLQTLIDRGSLHLVVDDLEPFKGPATPQGLMTYLQTVLMRKNERISLLLRDLNTYGFADLSHPQQPAPQQTSPLSQEGSWPQASPKKFVGWAALNPFLPEEEHETPPKPQPYTFHLRQTPNLRAAENATRIGETFSTLKYTATNWGGEITVLGLSLIMGQRILHRIVRNHPIVAGRVVPVQPQTPLKRVQEVMVSFATPLVKTVTYYVETPLAYVASPFRTIILTPYKYLESFFEEEPDDDVSRQLNYD